MLGFLRKGILLRGRSVEGSKGVDLSCATRRGNDLSDLGSLLKQRLRQIDCLLGSFFPTVTKKREIPANGFGSLIEDASREGPRDTGR